MLKIVKSRRNLKKLIQDYKPEKTASTDVTMRIILKDEEPVCQPPRRLAFTERQEVNKQIEEWLNEGHYMSEFCGICKSNRKKERWIFENVH
ncbi:RVP domain-containing protein [Trichonephila clavipes]|nr:RVP domain-containing protein [Trichonephila clavipes]